MNLTNTIAALAVAATASFATFATAAPVPSNFTYQGTLEVDGAPVLADADFIIRLYDGATFITSISRLNQPITNGQFQLNLNFTPDLFDGTNYDLEFLVRSPAGSGAYEVLSNRQPLSTTPYAYHANTANTLQTPAVIEGNEPTNLLTINQGGTSSDTVALRVTRGTATAGTNNFIDRVVEIETDSTQIGLLSIAKNFPIAAILNANAATSASTAVLGQIQADSPGFTTAFWGLNQASGNQARIATSDYAADLTGDLRLTGDITKQYTFGSFDLAAPIAYGFVNGSGDIANGTPNFNATWNAASSWYEIEIDDESYFFNRYVTVVTSTLADTTTRTTSSSGRLIIQLESTATQAAVQTSFQFVTYKTAGAALIQGQQRPPLIPLNTQYTDEQLNPNLQLPTARIPIIVEPITKSPIQRD